MNRSCETCKDEIARFLEDWVVHHIRGADREMAAFFRAQIIDVSTLRLPDVQTLKGDGGISAEFDEMMAMGAAGMRQF